MSGFHPDSDLKVFGGDVDRPRPVLELGPTGPWKAEAKITPLALAGGQRFEVHVAWAIPHDDDHQAEDRYSDTIFETDLELAKASAMAAIDLLRVPRAPVLLALRDTLSDRKS